MTSCGADPDLTLGSHGSRGILDVINIYLNSGRELGMYNGSPPCHGEHKWNWSLNALAWFPRAL